MKPYYLVLLAIILFAIPLFSQVDHYETIIKAEDNWHYFIGNSEPDASWNTAGFDASGWTQGNGGIGYGDGDDQTVIPAVVSLYMRRMFNVDDNSIIETAVLNIDYDDAFVAYLNGTEIARSGIDGLPPAYNQTGISHEALMKDGNLPEEFVIDPDLIKSVITNGNNVLAIQVHNTSSASSDMSAIPFLSVGVNVSFRTWTETPEWFTEPTVFTSSDLPVVVIDTEDGITIPDEPKISANMKIIRHADGSRNNVSDTGTDYEGYVGIEIRGAASSGYPQKPYGIETRLGDGSNNNVKIFGMPKENDWIMLANYNDKVFMRNTLAFKLFNEMGHYAPRTQFCELSLNGKYEGIYIFTERIKRDDGRVDIARLDEDDNAGDSITGGYIFKIDYFSDLDSWAGDYAPVGNEGATVHYVYHDPEYDEITAEQKAYIHAYISSMESVLYGNDFADPRTGYSDYLDVNSFIDYFIMGELTRNVDAYKKSKYYYKDKDSKDGLIHSGPVWDYDWAWKNLIDGCTMFNATDGSGWAYKIGSICHPRPTPAGWIERLMQDPLFEQEAANRYWYLRQNILSIDYLYHYIDSVALVLNEAQQRHYNRWPILGINVGAPEQDEQPTTFAGEIVKFKNWIATRIAWLDNNMPEATNTLNEGLVVNDFVIRVFPNPATDWIYVESDKAIQKIEICSMNGAVIGAFSVSNPYSVKCNLEGYSTGIYLIRMVTEESGILYKKFIIS
ncbi:CotH kinase family protein [Saccharicrinis sp. FJH54]|uniref:CotH kinase family protein n=1 Tax=Saccharicrinis sp. FJH54 TaxID=3344665 RepID=UPI0035D4E6B8